MRGALRDAVLGLGLEMRAGLHTGEVERRNGDVAGLAVVIARRICDAAGANEVLVSRTVTDLVVGSGLQFVGRRRARPQGREPGVAAVRPGGYLTFTWRRAR